MTDAAETTIRTRLAELTASCKTQLDLDAIVSTVVRTIRSEFPAASASEIMYELDCRKQSFRKMTRFDD
jgi:hypothetical protein